MFVRVDANLHVTLEEPHDFKRFHVEIDTGIDLLVAAQALGATARIEGDKTAWVSETALRAFPGVRDDRAWQKQLGGMLAYAKKKGWIDANGAIQAHVERK